MFKACCLVGVLLVSSNVGFAQRPITGKAVPVTLRAAIIDDDLTVKPIPVTAFQFISSKGDTVRIETDLAGVASESIPIGSYTVSSVAPVKANGQIYRWAVSVMVSEQMKPIELTSRNAQVEKDPTGTSVSGRHISEEAQVYERLKAGVFTVYGQQGKGSGFLIDTAGLVLTNAHVVQGTTEVRIHLDSITSVRGKILVVDKKRDVAVLCVAKSLIVGRPPLPLLSNNETPVVTGERLLAIGSPLNQTGILTTGLASRIEPRAIISTVNINHGNSGGPLLNLDGKVVGINTFGDFTDQGGPGISGSIRISEADSAISASKAALLSIVPPADSLMPLASRVAFPIEGLDAVAAQERFDLRPYSAEVGAFNLQILTPPVAAWRQAAAARELARRRKKREDNANLGASDRIDVIQGWTSWDEYVGQRKSVVIIQVMPRVGQTAGSAWGNFFGALAAGLANQYYVGHQTLEFKGDFHSLKLYRDSVEITPIELGRIPAVLNVQDYLRDGKDLAYQGLYVYRPEDFSPRPDGNPAKFTAVIVNTANPSKPIEFELNPKTVAAVWRDFAPYRIALAGAKQ